VGDPPIGPAELEKLQRETFGYFVQEANPSNGLIADKTKPGAPASIAAVGLALSSYPVGVARGFMSRADAVQRTLATLRFFDASAQGTEVDATGYKGFYYHWRGLRAINGGGSTTTSCCIPGLSSRTRSRISGST
jgi:hypothetical protein